MLNAFRINPTIYTLSTFPSSNQKNFEDSGKVLAISVYKFYQGIAVQLYQPTLIRWLLRLLRVIVCVNKQLFVQYVNRCPSVCIATVIWCHAIVSHLGMFSKIK